MGKCLWIDGGWPDGVIGWRDDNGGGKCERGRDSSGSFTGIIGGGFGLSFLLILLILALLRALASPSFPSDKPCCC